jgi:hypothetical protein
MCRIQMQRASSNRKAIRICHQAYQPEMFFGLTRVLLMSRLDSHYTRPFHSLLIALKLIHTMMSNDEAALLQICAENAIDASVVE